MADWIALAAFVVSLIVTITVATWRISTRIGEVVAELTAMGTRLAALETAFRADADEHSQIHEKLEQHGQEIVAVKGEVRALDGRVTRIEDET